MVNKMPDGPRDEITLFSWWDSQKGSNGEFFLHLRLPRNATFAEYRGYYDAGGIIDFDRAASDWREYSAIVALAGGCVGEVYDILERAWESETARGGGLFEQVGLSRGVSLEDFLKHYLRASGYDTGKFLTDFKYCPSMRASTERMELFCAVPDGVVH